MRYGKPVRPLWRLAIIGLAAGCGTDAAVTAPEAGITSVVVSPAGTRLTSLGEQVQLTAVATDSDGKQRSDAVAWSSSDESIATVGPTGLVTAVSNGPTRITATAGGISGHADVVVQQEIATILAAPRLAVLSVAESMTPHVVASDAGGSPIQAPVLNVIVRDGAVATSDGTTVTGASRGVTDLVVEGGVARDSVRIAIVDGNGLAVDARSNLFGAGRQSLPPATGGAGVLPPGISFAARENQQLSFSLATGSVNCCAGMAQYTADPDGSGTFGTNISSLNGISGLIHNTRSLFLAGVFLDDSAPAAPGPLRLDVSTSNGLVRMAPELNQTFFIGDGRTSADELQVFDIPEGATRLFLGFVDGSAFSGAPGFYDDNVGAVDVKFTIVDVGR